MAGGDSDNHTAFPHVDEIGFAVNVACSTLTVLGSLLVIFIILFYGKARLQTQRLILMLCLAHIPLTNMDFHPPWSKSGQSHLGFCVQVRACTPHWWFDLRLEKNGRALVLRPTFP